MVEYDAVVVGAGILGLATAYHIKRMKPKDKILLIDKMSAAGQGNTAKSAAMFRCFFYSKTNLTLADTSVEFYKFIQETLDVNLKIKWIGYLWLFGEEDYKWVSPLLKEMAAKNMQYRIYEAEELANMLQIRTNVMQDEDSKIMGLVNVDKGVFIPKAGAIDVDALVKFYESNFLKLGGKTQYSTEAKNLVVEPCMPLGMPGEPYFWQESKVTGIITNRGIIKAKKTILATGAWMESLLNLIGINVHVKPKKRQIFSIKAETEELRKLLWVEGFNPEGCLPFTILPKPRVYIKPAIEENSLWLCYGDEFPRAFQLEEDPQPEENFYKYGIYQVLTKYFPQFIGSQPSSSFAGLYAINTIDGQPVVFEENGLLVVGGPSGSGIMKADALGRIAASLYVGEEYATLYGDKKFKVSDLSIKERNVELEKLVI